MIRSERYRDHSAVRRRLSTAEVTRAAVAADWLLHDRATSIPFVEASRAIHSAPIVLCDLSDSLESKAIGLISIRGHEVRPKREGSAAMNSKLVGAASLFDTLLYDDVPAPTIGRLDRAHLPGPLEHEIPTDDLRNTEST